MDDLGFLLGGAAIAGLVSSALAWLLQRMMPRVHPVVTALIGLVLLVLLVVLGVGVFVARTLIAIGAAGHASFDGQSVPMALAVMGGIEAVMLLGIIGFPAALVAAFRRRKTYAASLTGAPPS